MKLKYIQFRDSNGVKIRKSYKNFKGGVIDDEWIRIRNALVDGHKINISEDIANKLYEDIYN